MKFNRDKYVIIHSDMEKNKLYVYIYDGSKLEDKGNFRMIHLSLINLKCSIGVY